MQCPYCTHKECKVIDSRHTDSKSIRRRRECESCKKRFTTYEKIETTPIMVIKKDDSREYFDGDKIKYGILKACEKRPVSIQTLENAVDNIEKQIYNTLDREIKSDLVGELVMEELKEIDEISYVRFASVYRQFKDIDTFLEEIENLKTNQD